MCVIRVVEYFWISVGIPIFKRLYFSFENVDISELNSRHNSCCNLASFESFTILNDDYSIIVIDVDMRCRYKDIGTTNNI